MNRFAFFVDGSNLYGSLRDMNVQVDNYEPFFRYIFEHAVVTWNEANRGSTLPLSQLRRVYWYVVGEIDEWDLKDSNAIDHLKFLFSKQHELRAGYMSIVGRKFPDLPQSEIADRAWELCLDETRDWYQQKCHALAGMKRFYHAVRTSTDYIDVVECARWRVSPLTRQLDEKGLDTRLAVDMVALADNYDVGLIVSGDYDTIPSVEYMKTRNKHIGAVEFLRGYPPESRGRSFSSHLKLHVDFVIQIYEMDLVRHEVARKQ